MPLINGEDFPADISAEELESSDEIFLCRQTGEIFTDYESLFERLVQCNSPIWHCTETGRRGLTFEEAVESELRVLRDVHCLPQAVHRAILYLTTQTNKVRLNDIVEDIYRFVCNRYFAKEVVEATISEVKEIAEVVDVQYKLDNSSVGEARRTRRCSEMFQDDSSLYGYTVRTMSETQSVHTVEAEHVRRRREYLVTRDKLRIFLKATSHMTASGVWAVKDVYVKRFHLKDMKFSDISPGDVPAFVREQTILSAPVKSFTNGEKSMLSENEEDSDKSNKHNNNRTADLEMRDVVVKSVSKSTRRSSAHGGQLDDVTSVDEDVLKLVSQNSLTNGVSSRTDGLQRSAKSKTVQNFYAEEDIDDPHLQENLKKRRSSRTMSQSNEISMEVDDAVSKAEARKSLKKERSEEKKRKLEEKRKSRREKYIERREEEKRKLLENKLREEEEQEKKRQERRELRRLLRAEIAVYKEMKKPREDLEFTDLKDLPAAQPLRCLQTPDLFGEIILVLEALNAFSAAFDMEFNSPVTIESLSHCLYDRDVNNMYADILRQLFGALLPMLDDPDASNGQDGAKESKLQTQNDDTADDDNSSVTADGEPVKKASSGSWWPLLNYGTPLDRIQLDNYSVTEVLRQHLLQSGACSMYNKTRTGFVSHDDPAMMFCQRHPDIVSSLAESTVFSLSPIEKLDVLSLVIHQMMACCSAGRETLQESLDKARSAQKSLSEHESMAEHQLRVIEQYRAKQKLTVNQDEDGINKSASEDTGPPVEGGISAERVGADGPGSSEVSSKRGRSRSKDKNKNALSVHKTDGLKQDKDTAAAVLTLKTDDSKTESSHKDSTFSSRLTEEELGEMFWTRLDNERLAAQSVDDIKALCDWMERKRAELKKELALQEVMCPVYPLGYDRTHRRYWMFRSVPGLFVEDDWDPVEDQPMIHGPLLEVADNSVKDQPMGDGPLLEVADSSVKDQPMIHGPLLEVADSSVKDQPMIHGPLLEVADSSVKEQLLKLADGSVNDTLPLTDSRNLETRQNKLVAIVDVNRESGRVDGVVSDRSNSESMMTEEEVVSEVNGNVSKEDSIANTEEPVSTQFGSGAKADFTENRTDACLRRSSIDVSNRTGLEQSAEKVVITSDTVNKALTSNVNELKTENINMELQTESSAIQVSMNCIEDKPEILSTEKLSVENVNSFISNSVVGEAEQESLTSLNNCEAKQSISTENSDNKNESQRLVIKKDSCCLPSTDSRRAGPWWYVYCFTDDVDWLIGALNSRGVRERALGKVMKNRREEIMDSIRRCDVSYLTSPAVSLSSGSGVNAGRKKQPEADQKFEASMREMLLDLEERIQVGCLGSLLAPDRKKWRQALERGSNTTNKGSSKTDMRSSNAAVVKELARCLLTIEQSIDGKFLNKPLRCDEDMQLLLHKSPAYKAFMAMDTTLTEDDIGPPATAIECWEMHVQSSTSLSQLFLCLSILETSVAWDKSILNARCTICRRSDDDDRMLLCDDCNRGFHTFCLRPKIHTIPEGDWFCRTCRPKPAKPRHKPEPSFENDEDYCVSADYEHNLYSSLLIGTHIDSDSRLSRGSSDVEDELKHTNQLKGKKLMGKQVSVKRSLDENEKSNIKRSKKIKMENNLDKRTDKRIHIQAMKVKKRAADAVQQAKNINEKSPRKKTVMKINNSESVTSGSNQAVETSAINQISTIKPGTSESAGFTLNSQDLGSHEMTIETIPETKLIKNPVPQQKAVVITVNRQLSSGQGKPSHILNVQKLLSRPAAIKSTPISLESLSNEKQIVSMTPVVSMMKQITPVEQGASSSSPHLVVKPASVVQKLLPSVQKIPLCVQSLDNKAVEKSPQQTVSAIKQLPVLKDKVSPGLLKNSAERKPVTSVSQSSVLKAKSQSTNLQLLSTKSTISHQRLQLSDRKSNSKSKPIIAHPKPTIIHRRLLSPPASSRSDLASKLSAAIADLVDLPPETTEEELPQETSFTDSAGDVVSSDSSVTLIESGDVLEAPVDNEDVQNEDVSETTQDCGNKESVTSDAVVVSKRKIGRPSRGSIESPAPTSTVKSKRSYSKKFYSEEEVGRKYLSNKSSFRTVESEMRTYEDLVVELMKLDDSWPFRKPVSKKDAPDYYDIVRQPMDFTTMRTKMFRLDYSTPKEIVDDIELILSNCELYNKSETPERLAGNSMRVYLERRLGEIKETLSHDASNDPHEPRNDSCS